jgi:hypothetical protein
MPVYTPITEELTEPDLGSKMQVPVHKLDDIEDELDQLMVTDPESYEQAMMDEKAHGTSA